MHDDRIEIVRPMSHDKPTTALGMLALLIAKCDSAGELAGSAIDQMIFRELAAEARAIDKAVIAERYDATTKTLSALERITDALGSNR